MMETVTATAGNDRSADAAQEHPHHEDDEDQRDDERALRIGERGAHCWRPVECNMHIDAAWKRCLQLRQHGTNAIDGGNDVRAWLAEYRDDDGRLAVVQAGISQILYAVVDLRNVA